MSPVQHPTNNAVLSPPAGMSHDECLPLPITRVLFSSGLPAVWSFWQPTQAERAAIAAGAAVRLSVIGHTHPPMALGVDGVEQP